MRTTTARIIVAASLIVVAAFAMWFVARGRVSRVVAVSEWDGHRQTDYKLLGFIPYSDVRENPSVRVSGDALAVLRASGLESPMGIDVQKQSEAASRTIRKGRVEYVLRVHTSRPLAEVVAFYRSQLKQQKSPIGGRGLGYVTGICADGKTCLELITDSNAGVFLLEFGLRSP